MTKKPIVIIYKESLAQSIISDISTFGFLLLCIWASWGSTGWAFLSACLFLVFVVAKASLFARDSRIEFHSFDDMQAWIDGQKGSQK